MHVIGVVKDSGKAEFAAFESKSDASAFWTRTISEAGEASVGNEAVRELRLFIVDTAVPAGAITDVSEQNLQPTKVYRLAEHRSLEEKVRTGGPGSVNQEVQARIDREVKGMASDYKIGAEADARKLQQRLEKIAKTGTADAADFADLFDHAYSVKAQGGTFGYPLMTFLGDRLFKLLERLQSKGTMGGWGINAIGAHVSAMGIVLTRDIKGDGGDLGRQVIANMDRAVREGPGKPANAAAQPPKEAAKPEAEAAQPPKEAPMPEAEAAKPEAGVISQEGLLALLGATPADAAPGPAVPSRKKAGVADREDTYGTKIAWSEAFSVGIEALDDDHKYLFDLVHEYSAMTTDERGIFLTDTVFSALLEYAGFHFAREEAAMMICHYPSIDRHREEHGRLVETVKQVRAEYVLLSESGAKNRILALMQEWIVEHVIKSDFDYRDAMRRHEVEISARLREMAVPKNWANGGGQ